MLDHLAALRSQASTSVCTLAEVSGLQRDLSWCTASPFFVFSALLLTKLAMVRLLRLTHSGSE